MTAAPFETGRTHARPLAPGDEALYCALYTDPTVMSRIGRPLSEQEALRAFRAACRCNGDAGTGERRWTIVDRGTGDPIGLLALVPGARDALDVEFGVMLLPAAQGRGLARELNDAVVALAFAPGGWGLRRLWARFSQGHAAAAGALAASGFVPGPPCGADATVEIRRGQR